MNKKMTANRLKSLSDKKYLISDERTEDNELSPTGRAYIGLSKRPLQKFKKGFGYLGVLLQTDNRQFIQCHFCGQWMKKITKTHLVEHNLTAKEYKQEVGLLPGTALVSDATSYAYEESARKSILAKLKKDPDFFKKFAEMGREGNAKQFHPKFGGITEHDNQYALCEKQLGYRLIEYVKRYKILPSRSVKGEGGSISKALFKRYGSLQEGFEHYGLPCLHRKGSAVKLMAANGKELLFNYNKNYNREAVYNWICDNTPSLKEPNKFKE